MFDASDRPARPMQVLSGDRGPEVYYGTSAWEVATSYAQAQQSHARPECAGWVRGVGWVYVLRNAHRVATGCFIVRDSEVEG